MIKFIPLNDSWRKERVFNVSIVLKKGILCILLLTLPKLRVGINLKRQWGCPLLKNSLKQDRFLYQWCSGRGSKASFSYSFFLEVPLIAPVIERQGLYCSSSSFWWNDALWAWSYQGRYIRRTTIFIFSFCIGLVTQFNGSALWVLKHHYITKRIR